MSEHIGKFLFAVVIIFTLLGVYNLNNYLDSLNETVTNRYDIKSVVDEKGIDGRFALGTGTIENTSYFLIYEIENDGGKIIRKYDSSKVKIYDDLEDSDTPYIEKTIYKTGQLKECKLYVPKDTIREEININLSNIK